MAGRETVLEPERRVPVFRKCNVLVVGGGPAGTAAAVAAARQGAETVLVERYGHLGGMSTGGFVTFIERMTDWSGRQVIAGFANDILDRLPREALIGPPDELWGSKDPRLVEYWGDRANARHGVVTWSPTIDPELLKIVSNDLVLESGAKMLLHSWAVAPIQEGNDLRGVIFESKSGRQAVLADVVIDATGDGDIFAMANSPFEVDEVEHRSNFKVNVAFFLGGVDFERYLDFRRNSPDEFRDVTAIGTEMGLGADTMPHVTPRNDVALFMGPKLDGYSAIDVEDLTAVELESRRRMMTMLDFYKNHMPGFEGAWVLSTASQMGTRHSRRLVGVKKVTQEDWRTGKIHHDEIGISPPPNPHTPNVSIPLGCLVPAGLDNLMAAGRNLSCDATVHAFLRLIPQCWEMGQAAGAAAAVAISSSVRVRDVDVGEVRRQLFKQGVVLHRDPTAAAESDRP